MDEGGVGNDFGFRCATDGLMFFYGMSTAGVTLTFFLVLFSEPYSETGDTIARVLFGSSLMVLGVSVLFKLLIEEIHQKYAVRKLKRVRNSLLIGFGGISICGSIPRILVFFLEDSVETHTFCIVIPILIAEILYLVFLYPFHRRWEIDFKPHYLLFTAISLFHFVISLITLGIIFENCDITVGFKVTNLIFTPPLFATGFIDFLAVLLGGLEWDYNGEPSEIPLVKVVKNVEKNVQKVDLKNLSPPKSSECEICLLEYSDSLLPRILSSCGHTICEFCAENFVKLKEGIACPFCRAVTEKVYKAQNLPVNHLALNLIKKEPGSESCGPCKTEYSDSVIPRVLVNCRHSLSEDCAEKLLENGDTIKCVACKKVTKGIQEPGQMPKNFIALELIKEAKNLGN